MAGGERLRTHTIALPSCVSLGVRAGGCEGASWLHLSGRLLTTTLDHCATHAGARSSIIAIYCPATFSRAPALLYILLLLRARSLARRIFGEHSFVERLNSPAANLTQVRDCETSGRWARETTRKSFAKVF